VPFGIWRYGITIGYSVFFLREGRVRVYFIVFVVVSDGDAYERFVKRDLRVGGRWLVCIRRWSTVLFFWNDLVRDVVGGNGVLLGIDFVSVVIGFGIMNMRLYCL
jgi:hypothetical protein